MRKVKHIIAVLIVLALVVGGGIYALPLLEKYDLVKSSEKQDLPDTTATVDTVSVQDTIPFAEKLQQELQTIKTEKWKKGKGQIWTLGRGQTIIVYLLQAQRFIQKNHGQVLKMKEVHTNSNVFQSAELSIRTPDEDTLNLLLNVSDNIFRDSASMMAVAFQVTSLTPEYIVALNQLDFPYTLLVPPFGMDETFFPDLDKIKNKELVLWIPMESSKLNKVHNKLRPLRIHHTEEQIGTIINDASKLVPSAKGLATRYGEQAMEHKQLLQAILSPVQKNNLWFLDISMNKSTKINETCKDFSIRCKVAAPYNPENSSLEDYISQKIKESNKSGLATMILPLNTESLNAISNLSERVRNYGTSLIDLSTFVKY